MREETMVLFRIRSLGLHEARGIEEPRAIATVQPKTALPVRVLPLALLAEELPEELHGEYGSKYVMIGGPLKRDDDSIIFMRQCPVGKKLKLLERNERGIFESVDEITRGITERLGNRKPVAIFHADCAARGKVSFNRLLKEEIINRLQGPICSIDGLPEAKKKYPVAGYVRRRRARPVTGPQHGPSLYLIRTRDSRAGRSIRR